jgi:hypothetical protein
MITSTITSRKRARRPCTMTSSLCRGWAIHPPKGVALNQDLLCARILGLALAQAAGARTITLRLKMTASQARSPRAGTCISPRVIMADLSIALTGAIPFLPPSPLQRQREVRAPPNRESCQQRTHASYLKSLFQKGKKTFLLIVTLS